MSGIDSTWRGFRTQMPVCEKWAWFDHAAVAPLSGPAQKAMVRWTQDVSLNGAANWGQWRKTIEATRQSAARLLGAATSEIGLIRNTTEGVTLIAEGGPWSPGDNVVVRGSEFPSNLYPWLNLKSRGVEVRVVEEPNCPRLLDALVAACDARTRIVAVSWCDYASGYRQNLDRWVEAVHGLGAKLFVDAIQALGVFPLDVTRTPVDFLAADGHKWLLGPEGAGLLYVRREHLDILRPIGVGWNSVSHAGDFSNTAFDLRDSVARYEGGSYNMAGLTALGASLDLLLLAGVARCGKRLLEVNRQIVEVIRDLGGRVVSPLSDSSASGIISTAMPDNAGTVHTIRKRCQDASVAVNCRSGRLRVSPHVYCNDDDIDRLRMALSAGR